MELAKTSRKFIEGSINNNTLIKSLLNWLLLLFNLKNKMLGIIENNIDVQTVNSGPIPIGRYLVTRICKLQTMQIYPPAAGVYKSVSKKLFDRE